MPLVSEFNYARIKQLQNQLTKTLEHLNEQLNALEVSSNRFKGQLSAKIATEALKNINESKKIIKKMNETVTEKLEAVKKASNKFQYIEEVLAEQLNERG